MAVYLDRGARQAASANSNFDIEMDESSHAEEDVEKALLSHQEDISDVDEDGATGDRKRSWIKRQPSWDVRNSRFATGLNGALSRIYPSIQRYFPLNRRRPTDSTSTSAKPPKRSLCATVRWIFDYPEPGIKPRKTAWLDALRGLAAFNVFIYHYAEQWVEKEASWADGPGNNPHAWWAMPFLRTWYDAGNAAVCLFFAISGYVLTARILGLIRQQRHEEVLGALSSALLRRGIRLYMPVVVITFLLMNWAYWTGIPLARDLELQPTYWLELSRWYTEFTRLWMPLRYPDRWQELMNPYDGNISWTIPLEYYGSITVYIALLLTARITSFGTRVALFTALMYMYIVKDEWYVVQFLLGAIYAEYQLVSEERKRKAEARGDPDPPRWRVRAFKAWMIFNLIFGLYLAGMPGKRLLEPDHRTKEPEARPFFDWMSGWWVPIDWYEFKQIDRYFWSAGANCIIVAFGELPALQRVLNKRPFQYLGRLSFGLYLCHIFVGRGILSHLDSLYLNIVGLDGSAGVAGQQAGASYAVAYFIRMVVATPVNLFVAGLFERWVDTPSVDLGKQFEKLVLRVGNEKDESIELSKTGGGPEVPAETIRAVVHELGTVPNSLPINGMAIS